MMRRKLSPHSFIKGKLNRWKQMLMERTVEDQNQAGTQIQIDIQNQILMRRLETLLTLMTVMIGRRPDQDVVLMSSSCWWFKKRFLLSSRSGAPVWTRRTQSPHTLKKNRRTSGPVQEASQQADFRGIAGV
ncbi:uncharacterized protein PEZ65_004902 [Lycodopsis pacificus]